MDRTILHCDCNAYFASVECLFRPELKSVPMAVCGDPEMRHGIVLAKNELAKACGVQTAEPIWQAKRKCPRLVVVQPQHGRYTEYCKKINAIYAQYTDQVEAFSVDESWLDVTGSTHLFGDGKTIADTLRKRLREEIGLTISVGVSFNKSFAKLGSDYKKPDATTVILRDNFKEIVWPLPTKDMLFVGKAAESALQKHGITTIGQIANADKARLQRMLGKMGESLWECANGLDASPVRRIGEAEPVKSVSNEITFPRDLKGADDLRTGLLMLSDQVCTRLRRQRLYGSVVHITIKDPMLHSITRQKRLREPTNITSDVFTTAFALLCDHWELNAPIRMLGVGISSLSGHCGDQISFLVDDEKKRRAQKLDATLDTIRERFGKDAIQYGSILQCDIKRKKT